MVILNTRNFDCSQHRTSSAWKPPSGCTFNGEGHCWVDAVKINYACSVARIAETAHSQYFGGCIATPSFKKQISHLANKQRYEPEALWAGVLRSQPPPLLEHFNRLDTHKQGHTISLLCMRVAAQVLRREAPWKGIWATSIVSCFRNRSPSLAIKRSGHSMLNPVQIKDNANQVGCRPGGLAVLLILAPI